MLAFPYKVDLTLPFLSYHEADFLTVDEALHPIISFLMSEFLKFCFRDGSFIGLEPMILCW